MSTDNSESKFIEHNKNAVSTNTAYDVVIVGAGLAGLVAAYELQRKAPALHWCIVEATDRIGGKLHQPPVSDDSTDDAPSPLDGEPGARWVSAEQTHIVQLCADLGVELAPIGTSDDPSARVWDLDQSVWAIISHCEVQRFMAYIDELAGDYSTNRRLADQRPRSMEKVICWHLWFEMSRQLVRLLVRFVSGCAPEDITFVEWMMLCNSTDGLTNQLKW